MDEAVAKAQRYYERDGTEKSVVQVWYYILGSLKRLSLKRSRHRELPSGTLSNLELLAQPMAARPYDEERVYINELLARMTPRTRQIFQWRAAGHTFRGIAKHLNINHTTVMRAYNRELRELILPGPTSDHAEEDDNDD
jgi:DNA-binding NarL/FixJ family response regulator